MIEYSADIEQANKGAKMLFEVISKQSVSLNEIHCWQQTNSSNTKLTTIYESAKIQSKEYDKLKDCLTTQDDLVKRQICLRRPFKQQIMSVSSMICLISIFICSMNPTYTISSLWGSSNLVGATLAPPHKSLYERHYSPEAEKALLKKLRFQDEDVPYLLTVNQVEGISVEINSKSNITINLNRAIPEDVYVRVSVNSDSDLIVFDGAQNTKTSSIDTYSNVTNRDIKKPNELIIKYATNTFGDYIIYFETKNSAGHAEVVCKIVKQPLDKKFAIDDKRAFVSVNVYKSSTLNVFIQIVGWIYFMAWSVSFYFQVVLNYKRKSVVGLNFDFLALNLLGFTCYSIYNFSLMFSYSVQQEYYKRFTYSRIPVEYNDLFFAIHAFVITLVTVLQCFIYERGDQQISLPTGIIVCCSPIIGFGLFLANLSGSVSILDVILYLSYVKLVITTIKYAPQAFMNYKRKATTGWSIHNIILDFIGGSFSILQMLLLAYNYNDWISIFGNFTKFGLGLVSMLFDIVFITQHYVLYRSSSQLNLVGQANDLENSSESCPSPVISQSIRSANQTNQSAMVSHPVSGNQNKEGTDGGESDEATE